MGTLRGFRLALLLAVCFIAAALLWWATFVWALLPQGSVVFYRWAYPIAFAWMVALFGLPVSLLFMVSRRRRPAALRWFAACGAILLGVRLGAEIGKAHRLKLMEEIPARARNLVAAIDAFERENGRPPDALEDLVPRHLPAIPPTGCGGHPEWFYNRAPYSGHPSDDVYGSNRWVLALFVGGRPMGMYRVLYLPDRRYPATFTRIGDWGYAFH